MGIFAHGTTVSIDSTDIGGLRSIDGPSEQKALVDVTDHDSGGDMEYVPGLRDGGTLDLGLLDESTDAGQQALWASYGDTTNALSTFIITVPADANISASSYTETFSGFVISRGAGRPYDGAATRTFSIKISGAVVNSLVSV